MTTNKLAPKNYIASLIILLGLSILLHGCAGVAIPAAKKAWEAVNASDTIVVEPGQWGNWIVV